MSYLKIKNATITRKKNTSARLHNVYVEARSAEKCRIGAQRRLGGRSADRARFEGLRLCTEKIGDRSCDVSINFFSSFAQDGSRFIVVYVFDRIERFFRLKRGAGITGGAVRPPPAPRASPALSAHAYEQRAPFRRTIDAF